MGHQQLAQELLMNARLADDPSTVDFLEHLSRYQQLRYLSRGLFGHVVQALDNETGETVAVKLIERGTDTLTRHVTREIVNHSSLSHPHIVQFRDCFLTSRYVAIVMEYCEGGNLWHYTAQRQGLPEDQARWFYQQLILALDYCHKMNISNRDIKLENALLDTDTTPRPLLRLCDFGYSINESLSLAKTAVGTQGYVAPEVLTNQRHYDSKLSDVWSSGVMLFAMMFCRYPFERSEDEGHRRRNQLVMQRACAAQYEFPPDKPISPECQDLLAKIFKPDPMQRIGIAGIVRHPWFVQGLPPGLDVDAFNMRPAQQPEVLQRAGEVRERLHAALRNNAVGPAFP